MDFASRRNPNQAETSFEESDIQKSFFKTSSPYRQQASKSACETKGLSSKNRIDRPVERVLNNNRAESASPPKCVQRTQLQPGGRRSFSTHHGDQVIRPENRNPKRHKSLLGHSTFEDNELLCKGSSRVIPELFKESARRLVCGERVDGVTAHSADSNSEIKQQINREANAFNGPKKVKSTLA